ncbi:MAG TPA: hypothetical protein VFS83_05580 [Ktedonobacterales bacterium]|nr:hypothetical protein [Ktedonobacterales bacterium]
MQTFWKRFFWGAPSHKSIAWAGAMGRRARRQRSGGAQPGPEPDVRPSLQHRDSGMGLLQVFEFAPGGPANRP